MMVTVGSLFTGIGGIDLGLQRAGMEIAWQVEIDPWCCKVLAKHWPDVPRYSDIKKVSELPYVDVIAGGFPCQPVSLAGKRLGQDDERWLWPEFERVIRMVRPRFVLVENVPGLLNRGMADVLGGLASSGYDAEWQIISAADVGAPHIRRRLWIVAYSNSDEYESCSHENQGTPSSKLLADSHGDRLGIRSSQPQCEFGGCGTSYSSLDGSQESLANTDGQRTGATPKVLQAGQSQPGRDGASISDSNGNRQQQPQRIFAESGKWAGDSGWWAVEPNVGRVAHGIPRRVDRLRGLGNAVVPQVVELIGRRIVEVAS